MADPAEEFGFEIDDGAGDSALRIIEEESRENPDLDFFIDFAAKKASHRKTPDDNESSWLVSYADMMTLLVGFFVMLLAFSKIDQAQFERIKRETTKVFGGEYKIPFEEISKKLKNVVENEQLKDSVAFMETDQGITITFRGALFFDSGQAILRGPANDLLAKLIPTIQEQAKDFGIVVEGHTDDSPISTKAFASNWELSSVRACTVLRMFEDRGFPKTRLKALGWGETRPVIPNRTSAGVAIPLNQAQNRRVVIKILKDFAEE